jgi:hypothetical protein
VFTLEPGIDSIFRACGPISLKHVSLWCLFLNPHVTIHHSNVGVQFIAMLELGTSTSLDCFPLSDGTFSGVINVNTAE